MSNNIYVEFLNTDENKYVPVNLLKTNYGFGGDSPDISGLVGTASEQTSPLHLNFPQGSKAIAMLINRTTNQIEYIKPLGENENRIRFDYRGGPHWIYVITKGYDDGFVNEQGQVDPEVTENDRMTTREDLVTLQLETPGALVASVTDAPDARQWYPFDGSYSGPLIWELPDGGGDIDLGSLSRELDNLQDAKAYLTNLYSIINQNWLEMSNLTGVFVNNPPTFEITDETSKEKMVRIYMIIDKFITTTWDFKRSGNFDDPDMNYDNSYMQEVWKRFQDEWNRMGLFPNGFKQDYSKFIDSYGYLIDRFDLGGHGPIDGYSSGDPHRMYVETQVGFSTNPYGWPDSAGQSEWIPENLHVAQSEYGIKNFNAIKQMATNPEVPPQYWFNPSGWNLRGVTARGGEMLLNLTKGNDNFIGLVAEAENWLTDQGIGIRRNDTFESGNQWWDTNIQKTANWFDSVYGSEDDPGWLFTEMERFDGLIEDKRTQFAMAFGSGDGSGVQGQELGFNAIMQNITFLKRLTEYLDDNLWRTITNTNSEILNKIIGIDELVRGSVNTNTLVNITESKIDIGDMEVMYRRLDDQEWHVLESVTDLDEDVKMLNLNGPYFKEFGKYVIMIRPKHIDVDINSLNSGTSIVSVYDQLNQYETPNYFYGWNIQFRDPVGALKGTEKIVAASYWDITGQYLQISPLIDGEVIAIDSNVKATLWNNSFIPIMITMDVVKYNHETTSYYMYGKKELNTNTGECTIYDHNGVPFAKQSYGTYATDESDRDIIDYRIPLE